MSGTNGVLDGVNGSVAAEIDYKAEAGRLRGLADAYLVERNRVGRLHLDAKAECKRLAAELATVQAECCRLTDVNGDLAKLAVAVGAMIAGFNTDRKHARKASMDADSPNGRAIERDYQAVMERAINGEVKPAEGLTEADVIDPSWQPDAPAKPLDAGLREVDAAISDVIRAEDDLMVDSDEFSEFVGRLAMIRREGQTAYVPPKTTDARLREAIERLGLAYSKDNRPCQYDEAISDLLEAWDDQGDESEATTAPQSPEPGVNARLLAAAKAVDASSEEELDSGNYGGDWTGVDDDALVELFDAINAAQWEGETAINGVNAAQIIREQSEVIKRLQAVESAALDFRAAYLTIPRDPWKLHHAFGVLDFSLDGLPKGGEAAPCGQSCDQPCEPAPCQGPCPERVHMLAIAARNLILAWRGNRFSVSDVNVLDFALDGLI